MEWVGCPTSLRHCGPHPTPDPESTPPPPNQTNLSIPRITVQRSPQEAAHLLLTHLSDRTIIPCVRSNTNSHQQRRNKKPREAPETRPRTQRPSPSQDLSPPVGRRPANRPPRETGRLRHKRIRHPRDVGDAISSPHGSRDSSLTIQAMEGPQH